jgi:hypothetical protein
MPTTRFPRRSSIRSHARTRLAQLERERRRILDCFPELERRARPAAGTNRDGHRTPGHDFAFLPAPRDGRVH